MSESTCTIMIGSSILMSGAWLAKARLLKTCDWWKSKDEYSWAFLTCIMLLLIWGYEKLCPLLFQNSELNVPENHQNVRENQITVSHLSIFWEWGFEENVKNRKCINYCKFNQKTLNTWKWSTRKNSNTCNVEQGKKIETSFG